MAAFPSLARIVGLVTGPRTAPPAPEPMVPGWHPSWRIEARGLEHRRGPAMALTLSLPRKPGEVDPAPFHFILVEERDTGMPRAGMVNSQEARAGGMESVDFRLDEEMGLVKSWIGDSAVFAFMDNAGSPPVRAVRGQARRLLASAVWRAIPEASFGPAFVEALTILRGFSDVPSPKPYLLFHRTAQGERFRAFCRDNPLLGEVAFHAAGSFAEGGRVSTTDIHPSLVEGRAKRLRDRAWTRRATLMARGALVDIAGRSRGERDFVDFLASTPPEWLPRGVREANAFVEAFVLARSVGMSPDAYPTLMRGCAGRWEAFSKRSLAPVPQLDPVGGSRVDLAASYLGDPVYDLRDRVVQPVLAAAGVEIPPREADEDRDAEAANQARRRAISRVARDLLYRDKALPGRVAVAEFWHRRVRFIRAELPVPPEHGDWPALFEERTVEGVVLRPLTNAREVDDEGSPGPDANGVAGLDHCVATYVPDARAGDLHLVSLRRPLPGGSYERLATAELEQSPDGTVTLVQLSGWDNGKPPAEAYRAMVAFLAANPRLPYVEPRETTPEAEVADACGYDWRDGDARAQACRAYAPLLPRHLRDPEALQAFVLEAYGRAMGEAASRRGP